LLAELESNGEGFVLAGPCGGAINRLDLVMRASCANLRIDDKVAPHDLRRTHGTRITALGFGRYAMNRIQSHKDRFRLRPAPLFRGKPEDHGGSSCKYYGARRGGAD
jgi:hypothetical protein